MRVIPARAGHWPADVPAETDFWLIDGWRLWSMRYAPDGEWFGAELVDDPQQIVKACAMRDAALAQSVSWHEYQRN